MHIVIRKFHVKAGSVDEVVAKARDTFLPLIQGAAGFHDYYFVKLDADHLCTVSCFESRPQAEDSVKLALDWVKRTVPSLVVGPPALLTGEVAFDAHAASLPLGAAKPTAQPVLPVH